MTETLEEVRDQLYKAFDQAMKMKDTPMENGNLCDRISARARSIEAAASAAQALATVENQIQVKELVDKATKEGAQVVLEISQGLVKDVKPLASIKLKQPGQ